VFVLFVHGSFLVYAGSIRLPDPVHRGWCDRLGTRSAGSPIAVS
jgi:hypothetical protein